MSENRSSKSNGRNAEFIRKLDQQRLLKKSTRIIDLRGKVPGECRQYEFGGLTHYLDDRGYLLAKHLLERFNGQYTIGVYEALLKGLKGLKTDTQLIKSDENRSILRRLSGKAQQIAFHQIIHRNEPRVVQVTDIEIRIDDVAYSAKTIDISTSSLKVTLKRVFTLEENDTVYVNFTRLNGLNGGEILSDIPYTIIKIDHDELRSYIILFRNRNNSVAVTKWLDNWSQQNSSLDKRDIDNELLNIASNYYLRIYGIMRNSPLFWLSQQNNNVNIEVFNSTKSTQTLLNPLLNNTPSLDFSLIPFNQLIASDPQDYLLIIYHEENVRKSVVAPVSNAQSIGSAFTYINEKSHLFLLQIHDVTISAEELDTTLKQLENVSKESSTQLISQLSSISHLASLSDITHCLSNVKIEPSTASPSEHSQLIISTWQGPVPNPSPIRPYSAPQQQRFFIRTSLKIKMLGETIEVITRDVSEQGLSITLNSSIKVPIKTPALISFVSWQKQTTSISLKDIPYIVRNIENNKGKTRIGFQRRNQTTNNSLLDQFFTSVIEKNQQQLAFDIERTFINQRSKILNTQLGHSTKTIPLFWGMDDNNKRILQAFAINEQTKLEQPDFWYALQSITTSITENLNSSMEQTNTIISLGIYYYQAKDGTWHARTETQFENAAQKSLFINTALQAKHYSFFNCSLSSIKASIIDEQNDLKNQLQQLRAHSSHKVKTIREVLHSLFAIGELTDITTVIKAIYENQNRH